MCQQSSSSLESFSIGESRGVKGERTSEFERISLRDRPDLPSERVRILRSFGMGGGSFFFEDDDGAVLERFDNDSLLEMRRFQDCRPDGTDGEIGGDGTVCGEAEERIELLLSED